MCPDPKRACSEVFVCFLTLFNQSGAKASMQCPTVTLNLENLIVSSNKTSLLTQGIIEKIWGGLFIERVSISRQSQDGSCTGSIFNSGKRSKHYWGKSIRLSHLVIYHLSVNYCLPLFLWKGTRTADSVVNSGVDDNDLFMTWGQNCPYHLQCGCVRLLYRLNQWMWIAITREGEERQMKYGRADVMVQCGWWCGLSVCMNVISMPLRLAVMTSQGELRQGLGWGGWRSPLISQWSAKQLAQQVGVDCSQMG